MEYFKGMVMEDLPSTGGECVGLKSKPKCWAELAFQQVRHADDAWNVMAMPFIQ